MSKNKLNENEEKLQAEERPQIEPDWKAEYLALLEFINDIGLQFMINYKNIRAIGFTNWQKQSQQQQTGGTNINR